MSSLRHFSLQPELLPEQGCRPVVALKAAETAGRESVRGRVGSCSGRLTTVASWRRTSRHSGTRWPGWKQRLWGITRSSLQLEARVMSVDCYFCSLKLTRFSQSNLPGWPADLTALPYHDRPSHLYDISGLHDNNNYNVVFYLFAAVPVVSFPTGYSTSGGVVSGCQPRSPGPHAWQSMMGYGDTRSRDP